MESNQNIKEIDSLPINSDENCKNLEIIKYKGKAGAAVIAILSILLCLIVLIIWLLGDKSNTLIPYIVIPITIIIYIIAGCFPLGGYILVNKLKRKIEAKEYSLYLCCKLGKSVNISEISKFLFENKQEDCFDLIFIMFNGNKIKFMKNLKNSHNLEERIKELLENFIKYDDGLSGLFVELNPNAKNEKIAKEDDKYQPLILASINNKNEV